VDAGARAAQRRARFIAAGLERFAADGYAATTVSGLCREAGHTQRYFYESFTDREALLLAIMEEIAGTLIARVAAVLNLSHGLLATSRAAIAEFVTVLLEDPRRVQILIIESVGVSPAVETRRRELLGLLEGIVREIGLATLAAEGQQPLPSRDDAELTARALVGAGLELMIGHVRGELDVDPDRIIEHLARLFVAAAPLSSDQSTTTRTPEDHHETDQ
jgi:AcrR family transcriptional regulator